jgi:hypothetical protein
MTPDAEPASASRACDAAESNEFRAAPFAGDRPERATDVRDLNAYL